MKSVASNVIARPIRVVQNTSNPTQQWGQIKCGLTNQVLHTGQLGYIRQVARKRYNSKVTFSVK